MMTISKQALIKLLGDRPIAYHPMLAKALGGVIEAVFVSQLLYWYDKGQLEDNWIWKTQAQWTDETGLTRSNQETARRKLKKMGLLKEKRKGVPGKIHFQLDLDKLADLLTMLDSDIVETQQCEDPANHNDETPQCITETTTENTPSLSLREQAENGEMTTETELAMLAEWGRGGAAGVADPSQDIGQYIQFRDEALALFDEKGGDFGRGQKQREARREAIIEFINGQDGFDLDRWRNTLHTSIVTGNVQPGNLACFFDVYEAGGDYQEMCRQRKNGGKHATNNTAGRVPGRVPKYSAADPAAFGEQPPDDAQCGDP